MGGRGACEARPPVDPPSVAGVHVRAEPCEAGGLKHSCAQGHDSLHDTLHDTRDLTVGSIGVLGNRLRRTVAHRAYRFPFPYFFSVSSFLFFSVSSFSSPMRQLVYRTVLSRYTGDRTVMSQRH